MLIAPSILSADFLRLGEEIKALEKAKADMIHLDIMDGHFVPNLSFGPYIVEAIKKASILPLDVHLMINNADCYVDSYINAGASQLILHVEAVTHLDRLIKSIKDKGVKVGVSLNPSTHEHALRYILDFIDTILVMSVNPGFCSQKFIDTSVQKIKNIKSMIKESKNTQCQIAVDGGINEQNIGLCHEAGANIFVVGSYVFNHKDYAMALEKLRSAIMP